MLLNLSISDKRFFWQNFLLFTEEEYLKKRPQGNSDLAIRPFHEVTDDFFFLVRLVWKDILAKLLLLGAFTDSYSV